MLTRILAVLATLALSAGLAVTTATPASASETCNSAGYLKPAELDASSGDADFPWGSLTWSGKTLTYQIDPGWTVDLCLKASTEVFPNDGMSGTGKITLTDHDISHVGYRNPQYSSPTALTCDAATLYKGSPLTNGDHITMEVTRNGGPTFQVNAAVDIRQEQDPASDSGLVVRLKLPTGDVTLPITIAQRDAGVLEFRYSEGWTGTWTVRWVQYNSSYFNQDNLRSNDLHCDGRTPVTVSTVPSATPPSCDVDGSLVVPSIPHITWTGGSNGAGPGEYTLVAAPEDGYTIEGEDTFPVTVLGQGEGLDCVEALKPELTPAVCEPGSPTATSAYILIPDVDHLTYRVDGGVYAANEKVDLGVGTHAVTVETESGWSNAGPDSFEIAVVPTPGCDQPVNDIAPTVNPQICVAGSDQVVSGSIEFTAVEHLTYFLDGDEIVGDATLEVAPGDYQVTAVADDGYFIAGTAGLTEKVVTVTVRPADGCDEAVPYVAPGVQGEVCDTVDGGADKGTVTFTLQPHLGYVFDGVPVDASHLSFDRSAGDYTLVVTAEDGYFIAGEDVVEKSYQVTVGPASGCDELVTLPLDPYATPETCIPGSLDGGVDDGALTVVGAEHVTFSISNDLDGVRHEVATPVPGQHYQFPYPAGDYHVWAELHDGYITHGATSWALTVAPPSLDCDLPTFALLPTGVSWTVEKCTDTGVQPATITVEPFTGVSYFIDGQPVTTTTTIVAAGVHEVTAEADEPSDSVETASWSITLAAAPALCGELTTLALTGGDVDGIGALSLIVLLTGVVLVAVATLGRRSAARHREG